MATLTAEEIAEYAKLSPDLHPVLELSLPGGTKRYVTEGTPLASDSLGTFEGKVAGGDAFRFALDDRVQTWEQAVTIIDFDHTLDAILNGANAKSVRGSAFLIRIASAGVPQAKWTVRAGGRVADWTGDGQFRWKLVLRSNDAVLQGSTVPREWISPSDFPDIGDNKLYGTRVPIVYGLFDSRDGTAPGNGPIGCLPGYYVDTAAGAQLVLLAQHDVFHVERIFFDGTVQSSSNWSRVTYMMPGFQAVKSTPPYGRRKMAFAKFTASGPTVNNKITWDGYGLCNSWFGVSGATPYPFTNPVDILQHLYQNFVLPRSTYADGAWAADDSPFNLIDTTSWAAARAWAEARAMRGSLLVSDAVDGLTLFNDFAASHGFRWGWTLTGKLALKPRDPQKTFDMSALPWLHSHEPEANPITPRRDSADITTELSAETFNVPAQGGARNIVTVADYSQLPVSRVAEYVTARNDIRSRTGTRRRFGAGAAFFLRVYLSSPKGVYFADRMFDNVGGGDVYDGVALGVWPDIKNGTPKYDLAQATGANQPTIIIGAVASQPSVLFDGVNDYFSGTTMSNLLSVGGFHVAVAVKATANGGAFADAAATSNPAVWCESAGKVGLYHQFTGGQNYLQFAVNDGALQVAKVPISLNTWYVVSMALLNGTAYVAKNLFSPATIACGNVASLAGTLFVGSNPAGTGFFTGEMFCLLLQNATDIAKQGGLAGVWGGGNFFYCHQAIADMLRLSESVWV